MTKTLVERYVEDPDHMRLFQQERAIYEATELLESTMAELEVTRTDLAKLLGKSKGWITQLLDGESNKTIRTVADAFAVLGREYCSFQRPIRIGNQSPHVASARVTPSAGASTRQDIDQDVHVLKMYRTGRSPATSVIRMQANE
ncbi:MAG TPA: hypothetical protein DDY78_14950 [Planctomycetales bacterium]|jgi:transcriptional regulator with XRE-family HTH domain|nr:hypothetical protein [Planctomycetales bacterium]